MVVYTRFIRKLRKRMCNEKQVVHAEPQSQEWKNLYTNNTYKYI